MVVDVISKWSTVWEKLFLGISCNVVGSLRPAWDDLIQIDLKLTVSDKVVIWSGVWHYRERGCITNGNYLKLCWGLCWKNSLLRWIYLSNNFELILILQSNCCWVNSYDILCRTRCCIKRLDKSWAHSHSIRREPAWATFYSILDLIHSPTMYCLMPVGNLGELIWCKTYRVTCQRIVVNCLTERWGLELHILTIFYRNQAERNRVRYTSPSCTCDTDGDC